MAGILHNVFSKGIYTLKDPDNVSKIKTLVNHSALYFGLIVYTAIGAKVSLSWSVLSFNCEPSYGFLFEEILWQIMWLTILGVSITGAPHWAGWQGDKPSPAADGEEAVPGEPHQQDQLDEGRPAGRAGGVRGGLLSGQPGRDRHRQQGQRPEIIIILWTQCEFYAAMRIKTHSAYIHFLSSLPSVLSMCWLACHCRNTSSCFNIWLSQCDISWFLSI